MISQHPLRCWIVVGRHSTYGNINRSVGGHLMLHTVVSQDSHEALESEKFLEDEALSLGARLYHARQDRKAAQEGFERRADDDKGIRGSIPIGAEGIRKRSEERRAGKEGVSPGGSGGSPDQ